MSSPTTVAASLLILCLSTTHALNATLLYSYPVSSPCGYASEGFALFTTLLSSRSKFSQHNLEVHVRQHGDAWSWPYWERMTPSQREEIARHMHDERRTAAAPTVEVCHSEPGAMSLPKALYSTPRCPLYADSYHVARTMFETDRLPEGWADRLSGMDEVWVPSGWGADIFEAALGSRTPIQTVGEAVDTNFFKPADVPRPASGRYEFLSIFKFEKRKGYDVLLEAYFEEFTADEDVALTVLVSGYHGDGRADFEAYLESLPYSPSRPALKIIQDFPQDLMPSLYQGSDCFVLPTRGEGWGRPFAEALSCGIPVIATNFGGQSEFLTSDNSWILQPDGLEEVGEGAFRDHKWAKLSSDKLRGLMREAFEGRAEGRRKGERGRRDMVRDWGGDAVAVAVWEKVIAIAEKRERETNRGEEL